MPRRDVHGLAIPLRYDQNYRTNAWNMPPAYLELDLVSLLEHVQMSRPMDQMPKDDSVLVLAEKCESFEEVWERPGLLRKTRYGGLLLP
jgi:hypothetical protein